MTERRAQGVSLAQVDRELDIRPEQLRAWALAESGGGGSGTTVAGETMDQEVRRLRRENAVLRQEQAFAKNCRGARYAPSVDLKLPKLLWVSRVAWPFTYWCSCEPVKKHGPGVTADLRVVTPACGLHGDPV